MKTSDCAVVLLLVLTLSLAWAQREPKFIKRAKTKDSYEVLRGESVKLKCYVTGIEDPPHNRTLVAWKKEGVSGYIYKWSRYTVKVGKYLKIVNTIKEDSGKYWCIASNEHGKIQRSINLIVREGVISDSSIIPGELQINKPTTATSKKKSKKRHGSRGREGYAPRFNRPASLQNRILSYPPGDTVKLKCHASGKPEPSIKWYKDGKDFGRVEIAGLSSNSWVLQLRYLGKPDAGKYTCVVSNIYGTINSTFMLEVRDKPLSQPLVDKTALKNVTARAGDNVTFTCTAYSEAPPGIQWLKWSPGSNKSTNGTRIHFNFINERAHAANQHLTMEMEKRRPDWYIFKLHLSNVQSRDQGRYACFVSNKEGYSSADAFLTVTAKGLANAEGLSGFEVNVPLWVFIVVPVVLCVALICIVVWCLKITRNSSQPEKKPPVASKPQPDQVKLPVNGPVYNGYSNRYPINPEKFLNFHSSRVQNCYIDWNKPQSESVVQTKSTLAGSEELNESHKFDGSVLTSGSRRSEPTSEHLYADIDSRSLTSASTNHTAGRAHCKT